MRCASAFVCVSRRHRSPLPHRPSFTVAWTKRRRQGGRHDVDQHNGREAACEEAFGRKKSAIRFLRGARVLASELPAFSLLAAIQLGSATGHCEGGHARKRCGRYGGVHARRRPTYKLTHSDDNAADCVPARRGAGCSFKKARAAHALFFCLRDRIVSRGTSGESRPCRHYTFAVFAHPRSTEIVLLKFLYCIGMTRVVVRFYSCRVLLS